MSARCRFPFPQTTFLSPLSPGYSPGIWPLILVPSGCAVTGSSPLASLLHSWAQQGQSHTCCLGAHMGVPVPCRRESVMVQATTHCFALHEEHRREFMPRTTGKQGNSKQQSPALLDMLPHPAGMSLAGLWLRQG